MKAKEHKTSMKLQWRVKLFNDFTEPYWLSNGVEPIARHKSIEEYAIADEKVLTAVLDGFLDAPKKPLDGAMVRKDFESTRRKLSQRQVDTIKAYYNGRLALAKKVYKDLAVANAKADINFPIVLKYQLPIEINAFSCEDESGRDSHTVQNEAYLEIEVAAVE